MKRILCASSMLLVLTVAVARAEKPSTAAMGAGPVVSSGELKATPEMWFYEQSMRQYKDPKVAVREKAAFRDEQRRHRLETMKWFGFSNARPRASSDPFHGDYASGWVASPGFYPSRWSGIVMP
jgi:hypothetical protein